MYNCAYPPEMIVMAVVNNIGAINLGIAIINGTGNLLSANIAFQNDNDVWDTPVNNPTV